MNNLSCNANLQGDLTKWVSIYVRPRDGLYVIPDGFTTQGFRYHVEPFEYLPAGASAIAVWEAIGRAFQNANRVVPHPPTWKEERPWYRKAGVKTWRSFTHRATAVTVTETDRDYTFNLLEREGSAFAGRSEGKTGIPKSAPREQIIALLTEYLNSETDYS